ncbi:ATP-binding protein [Flocculibacter collagenilyticus]|uniref:ATP-binding protein n=1 Tax=Flocculibacter collagenilyticus TaxID=2744479 RepID=UPI0018F49DB2|nr:tetratricopeptide repeat protein [Flocculibacter collagenilyticus]
MKIAPFFLLIITLTSYPTFALADHTAGSTTSEQMAAFLQLRSSNPAQAIALGKNILPTLTDKADREKKLTLLHHLGRLYFQLGQPKQTITVNKEALSIADKSQDLNAKAQALNDIGIGYYQLGQYDKALTSYQDSYQIRQTLPNKQKVADSLNNIGLVYRELGKMEPSLAQYLAALEIYTELDLTIDIADVHTNIAGIYLKLNDLERALSYYQNSLAIFQEMGYQSNIAATMGNLAVLFQRMGDFQQSIDFYQRALRKHQELGETALSCATLNNMGGYYLELGKADEALTYLNTALSIAKKFEYQSIQANITHSIAEAYLQLNQLDTALSMAKTFYSLAQKVNDKLDIGHAYELFSKVYEQRAQHDLALDYFKKYKTLNDEVIAQKHSLLINNERERINNDNLRKLFAQMKQNNIDLKSRHQQQLNTLQLWLVAAGCCLILLILTLLFNRRKLKFIAEKYANVRNQQIAVINQKLQHKLNQDIITPLHTIVAKLYNIKQQPDLTENSQSSLNNLYSEAAYYSFDIESKLDKEQLNKHSLYLQKHTYNLNMLLKETEQLLRFALPNMTYSISYYIEPSNTVIYADTKRIQQVIFQLLKNAVLHGKATEITISAKYTHQEECAHNSKQLMLTIEDNGNGFDSANVLAQTIKIAEPINPLSHTTPSRAHTPHANGGLNVCQNLIQLHSGTLTVSSIQGEGTTITITITLPNHIL